MSKETKIMILTDKKSIIDLIGQDIVAEIADDHVHGTEEFNSDFPAVNRLKEAWWEEAESSLDSFQLHDFLNRIDFDTIADEAIEQAELRQEAENEANDLDGWEYDRETGEYNERRYW